MRRRKEKKGDTNQNEFADVAKLNTFSEHPSHYKRTGEDKQLSRR